MKVIHFEHIKNDMSAGHPVKEAHPKIEILLSSTKS